MAFEVSNLVRLHASLIPQLLSESVILERQPLSCFIQQPSLLQQLRFLAPHLLNNLRARRNLTQLTFSIPNAVLCAHNVIPTGVQTHLQPLLQVSCPIQLSLIVRQKRFQLGALRLIRTKHLEPVRIIRSQRSHITIRRNTQRVTPIHRDLTAQRRISGFRLLRLWNHQTINHTPSTLHSLTFHIQTETHRTNCLRMTLNGDSLFDLRLQLQHIILQTLQIGLRRTNSARQIILINHQRINHTLLRRQHTPLRASTIRMLPQQLHELRRMILLHIRHHLTQHPPNTIRPSLPELVTQTLHKQLAGITQHSHITSTARPDTKNGTNRTTQITVPVQHVLTQLLQTLFDLTTRPRAIRDAHTLDITTIQRLDSTTKHIHIVVIKKFFLFT